MRITRALASASVVSMLLAAAITSPAAAAKTIVVDDNGLDCKNADYTTIQAAVTAAPANGKIQVCDGTYVEQVTIPATKNGLDLSSKKHWGATIKAPAAMVGSKAIVQVTGAQDVRITDFVISGPGGGGCDSIRWGVRLDGGASATIEKNHITMIRDAGTSGCQNGVGILVGRQSETQTATATIRDNLIDDYQKNGLTVDNTGSYANITHNVITGPGPIDYIATNGAQISRGATADVDHNTISDNIYTPQSTVSTNILLFQSGAVNIDHNTLLRADVGLDAFQASGLVASHNESSDNVWDGFFLENTTGAKLSHNDANDNGEWGIGLWSDSSNNVMDHNKMSGNGDVDAYDGNRPANTWTHNKCDTDTPPGTICE